MRRLLKSSLRDFSGLWAFAGATTACLRYAANSSSLSREIIDTSSSSRPAEGDGPCFLKRPNDSQCVCSSIGLLLMARREGTRKSRKALTVPSGTLTEPRKGLLDIPTALSLVKIPRGYRELMERIWFPSSSRASRDRGRDRDNSSVCVRRGKVSEEIICFRNAMQK